MKKLSLLSLLLFINLSIIAQTSIEGSFMVDNVEKTYALYIPENYDPSVPNTMMLGLHPLNVNRWNAISWRDTLIDFSESNGLILVCPDGGPDGRVDDPIDTLFTSMLVDSVEQWYAIDQEEKYVMGFSWGARTTYTYGLRRTDEYKGLLAIGAAVDISIIQDVLSMAQNQAIYVLHGSLDAVGTRYNPIVNALEQEGACVTTNLLSGVGHTIDFPNRNTLLTEAFTVLKNSNCGLSSSVNIGDSNIIISPNPNSGAFTVENIGSADMSSLIIYNTVGQTINHKLLGNKVIVDEEYNGVAYLQYNYLNKRYVKKLLIQ